MFVSAILIAVLAIGCGNGGDTPTTEEPGGGGAGEVVDTGDVNETEVSEEQGETVEIWMSWVIDEETFNQEFWETSTGLAIAEATGLEVRFAFNDMERLQMLLATGDLPCIVNFDSAPPNFEEILIENGHIFALDELFEQYGQNYLERHRSAVEFSRKFWSQDTGRFYFIPVRSTGPMYTSGVEDFGLTIRWDLYSELGYPPINSIDDLLDVLEQMVELEPETPDGRRTYAVTSFTDWGTFWQFAGYSKIWMGSMYDVPGWFTYLDNTPGQPLRFANALTDEDSVFWQQAEFFFEANQRGLLDPDAFMQTWNQKGEKITSGSIFLVPYTWLSWGFDMDPENYEARRGYMNLPIPGHGTLTRAPGHTWEGLIGLPEHRLAITTNNPYPERTVQFIDFLSTPEGGRLLFTGVQGERWDVIDGVPQVLPRLIELRENDRETFNELYGTFWHLQVFSAMTAQTLHPDGHFMNLWLEDEVLVRGLTPLQRAYSEHFGVQLPVQIIQQMLDRGELFTIWQVNDELGYAAFNPVIPENLRLIEQRVEGLAQTLLAEATLSADRAEFDARKADAIAQFNASGINEVFEVYLQAWIEAHEAVSDIR